MPIFLASESFNATTSLEMAKTVLTWLLDVIKGEPILAAAFVAAVLVPIGFKVVRGVKKTAK